jgi:hypothetical protein
MIQLNKKSFLSLSEDTQTSNKVELLSVSYNHYLGKKLVDGTSVQQGYIQSVVCNESMISILSDLQEDTDFNGNILIELTDNYIAKLKQLNSDIVFTNTLK